VIILSLDSTYKCKHEILKFLLYVSLICVKHTMTYSSSIFLQTT
jgi:hypothetical protein